MSAQTSRAVFLSYASQDAEAARRICEALRAAGVEVWFDQSELRGGDAWDAKIRKQIKECALFVPIISANTQARLEGYFRLEWKLAAQRTHTMAEAKPFLVPVCIDDTRDGDAHVPEEFRAVQWTRLPNAETPARFCERVKALLPGRDAYPQEPSHASTPKVGPIEAKPLPHKRTRHVAALAFGLLLVVGLSIWRPWRLPATPTVAPAKAATLPTSRATPPVAASASDRSVAVLPFEKLSLDPADAVFSDGLHAEAIATLGQIPGWKVIMRQSSLEFTDRTTPLSEIGRRLGVAHLVTGSVRRGGDRVVVLLEVRRASDDGLVWRKRFDRPFQGTLAVQAEVAGELAQAFHMREARGAGASAALFAKNPRAFELHLKAMTLFGQGGFTSSAAGYARHNEALKLWEEAAALDPGFMWAAWGASGLSRPQLRRVSGGGALSVLWLFEVRIPVGTPA